MCGYRDAIVSQNNASPYERTMFGAYVLFPYHNEEEYRNHPFYQSIEKVNIGGLPFLPSATQLVSEMLDELISDSPESAFERATLPRGIEKKLAKVDWSRRDVLIGTLSSREQLDVCLEHGFYHIPVKRISRDHLPVHSIALYQTRALFGTDARIEYYGEVLNYSVLRRSEITELPKDSDELYYRFEIREWKKLPKPIRTGEIGFYTAYTNRFLLEHSDTASELFIRSEDQYRFYSELKRRTDAQILREEDAFSGFRFKDVTVSFAGGQILLLRDGKIVDQGSVSDFSRTPGAVFRKLMRSVDEKCKP